MPESTLIADPDLQVADDVMIHANDAPDHHPGWGQILGFTQLTSAGRLRLAYRVGFVDGKVEYWPVANATHYSYSAGMVS